MSTLDEQSAKLEYLKLLIKKNEEIYSDFMKSLRNFYIFSLIFFIFTWFKTSELSMFGAKVEIPEDWLTALAPLILSSLYVIEIYQFNAQYEYRSMVRTFLPEAIKGGNWEPSADQVDMLTMASIVGVDPDVIEDSKIAGNIGYLFMIILAIGIFIIPLVIIFYFLRLLWQLEFLLIIVGVSIISIIISVIGLILFISLIRRNI